MLTLRSHQIRRLQRFIRARVRTAANMKMDAQVSDTAIQINTANAVCQSEFCKLHTAPTRSSFHCPYDYFIKINIFVVVVVFAVAVDLWLLK